MDDFDAEWSRCAPWIAAALEYCGGTHELDDVRAAVLSGRMLLWPGDRCAAVTETVQYPRLKALRVFAAGGDLAELKEMEKSVSAWAAAAGCSRVEAFGRLGWRRMAERRGYAEPRLMLWKEL